MLIQVDCLQMFSCIILCRFLKDTACLSLLFLWPALHIRAEWGDSIRPVLPSREPGADRGCRVCTLACLPSSGMQRRLNREGECFVLPSLVLFLCIL